MQRLLLIRNVGVEPIIVILPSPFVEFNAATLMDYDDELSDTVRTVFVKLFYYPYIFSGVRTTSGQIYCSEKTNDGTVK